MKGVHKGLPFFSILKKGGMHPMEIFIVNGSKVWLDENNVPAGAVPYNSKPKKKEPEQKAEPEIETKAKKAPANKARKAGSNK